MGMPVWMMGTLLGAGMSKGDVNVQTSTSQSVNQSANINVNPVIAVSSPAAHFDPQNNLEPNTNMEAIHTPDQSWRQGDPGSIGLPSATSTQYGPYTSTPDNMVENGEGSLLDTVTSMPAILVVSVLAAIALVMMKKRGRK